MKFWKKGVDFEGETMRRNCLYVYNKAIDRKDGGFLNIYDENGEVCAMRLSIYQTLMEGLPGVKWDDFIRIIMFMFLRCCNAAISKALPSFITVSIRRPPHALQAKYRSTQATPVECLEGN